MAQINIDAVALKNWCIDNRLMQKDVSEKLGRHKTYISQCICNGAINENAYKLLLGTYNLPSGSFLPKTEEKTKAAEHGSIYSVSLEVHPDKVRMGLNFKGEELYHAYAKVKGEDEVDLVQSISYAAHMVYKMAEQNALSKKGGRR